MAPGARRAIHVARFHHRLRRHRCAPKAILFHEARPVHLVLASGIGGRKSLVRAAPMVRHKCRAIGMKSCAPAAAAARRLRPQSLRRTQAQLRVLRLRQLSQQHARVAAAARCIAKYRRHAQAARTVHPARISAAGTKASAATRVIRPARRLQRHAVAASLAQSTSRLTTPAQAGPTRQPTTASVAAQMEQMTIRNAPRRTRNP
jgi:hypothetical protein